MAYADVTTVRRLAGNPSTTSISDADISSIILYSDKRVDLMTGHTTAWDPSDPLFPVVKSASEHFAAARIREMYNDPDKTSDKQYQVATDMVNNIVSFSTSSAPSALQIVKSNSYTTYPLNLQGEIFWTNRTRRIGNVSITSKDVVFP